MQFQKFHNRLDPITHATDWVSSKKLGQIATIALPWIALSNRGSRFLTVTCGGMQVFSLSKELKEDFTNRKWLNMAGHSCEVVFLTGSIAAAILSPRLAICFSIAAQGVELAKLAKHFYQGENRLADLGNMTSTGVHMASLVYQHPALLALSLFMQSGSELYKAYNAVSRENGTILDYIEALSFASLGCMRTVQGTQHLKAWYIQTCAKSEEFALSPMEEESIEIDTNDGPTNDLKDNLIKGLKSAKKSISLLTYAISDYDVLSTLDEKAKAGLDVRIYIDDTHFSTNQAIAYPDIKWIKRSGDGHFHHKVAMVDNDWIWLSGANFTSFCLKNASNVAVHYRSPKHAKLIQQEMDYLDNGTPRKLIQDLTDMIAGQKVEFYIQPSAPHNEFMPLEEKMNEDARERISDMIKSAQKSIRISMCVWTHEGLADDIIKAHKRGVDVQIAIDNPNDFYSKYNKLKTAGIKVFQSSGKHQKYMLIDDKDLFNGSGNWSLGMITRNDESFVIVHDLNATQLATLDEAWANTPEL